MGGGLVWTGGAPPQPINESTIMQYPGPAKDGTPGYTRYVIDRPFPGGMPEIQQWLDSFKAPGCVTPQDRVLVAVALWFGDTYQVVYDKKDLPVIPASPPPDPGVVLVPSTAPVTEATFGQAPTLSTGPATFSPFVPDPGSVPPPPRPASSQAARLASAILSWQEQHGGVLPDVTTLVGLIAGVSAPAGQ